VKTNSRRISYFGAVAVAVAMVATACLGPGQFDPTLSAPIGSLDVMVDSGGSIHVSGWAFDPQTRDPIIVKVGSEGVVHDVPANLNRPDIAAAYPFYGPNHGFDHTFGYLEPGLHGICVWVKNQAGRGDDRLLGCKNLVVGSPDPIGSLDNVSSPGPRRIAVQGWGFDPNSGGSAEAVITINGQFARRVVADSNRPDVGAAYGRTAAAGFDQTLDVVPGNHQVCVSIVNVAWGNDADLGCRGVSVAEVPDDRRPTGLLTAVTPQGGGNVAISGIAADPDGAVGQVRLDVTGATVKSVVVGVGGGSFATTLTLNNGANTICPVGIDVPGSPGVTGDRQFSCGAAILNGPGGKSVGTAGVVTLGNPGGGAVGPPPGHPLQRIERDGGVSTRLTDGNQIWFFGDSAESDGAGGLKYFINNTAAWAQSGSLSVTRDAVDAGPKPFTFSTSAHACAPGTTPARWPESAVTIPQGVGVDKVVVFMSKVCLGNSFLEITPVGMSIVETTYNSAAAHNGVQILSTTTLADVGTLAAPWGKAAYYDAGYVYVHQCTPPNLPNPPTGPCKVARVAPGSIADFAQWRFWNGGDAAQAGSWVASESQAASMSMPAAPGATGPYSQYPVASFSVTKDPVHNLWVMAYAPWPGFATTVFARIATSPAGPWSQPMQVDLPGCGGAGNYCYAGTTQPWLSSAGRLGFGYMDQSYDADPSRSQYMAATVPFSVL